LAGWQRKSTLRRELERERIKRLRTQDQLEAIRVQAEQHRAKARRGVERERIKRLRTQDQLEAIRVQAEQHRAKARRGVEREQARARSFQELRQQERSRVRDLSFQLKVLPRYDYGSLTPGIAPWGEKWRQAEGRRILFWDPMGMAGMGMRLAEAVHRATAFAVRDVTLRQHPYGYPVDLLFPALGLMDSGLERLVEETDVIVLVDESFFLDESRPVPAGLEADLARFRACIGELGKPVVFCHYGGFARKFKNHPLYRRSALSCAARIAWEPDLAYPWFDCHYIPVPLETQRVSHVWSDGWRIGHSPSVRGRKGTSAFLEAVQGLDVEVDLIEGVSHAECLERQRHCNLFFDQAGQERMDALGVDDVIGWYGTSALEAAVHGIPTMVHLSEDALSNARRCGVDVDAECPFINVPTDAVGIRAVIEAYFRCSVDERAELSARTRAWVQSFHDSATVARRLVDICARL
jgi:hypothetical protein